MLGNKGTKVEGYLRLKKNFCLISGISHNWLLSEYEGLALQKKEN